VERGLNFEVWENIPGNDLKMLFNDPRYPDNPDNTQTLPSLSTPENRGDNYGARVTGYYQVKENKSNEHHIGNHETSSNFFRAKIPGYQILRKLLSNLTFSNCKYLLNIMFW
jgi:hypothetical protein